MKTVLISLIGALTLGAALPASAGPDWQIIEQGRMAKHARLQQAAPSSTPDSSGSSETGNSMSGMPMQKCADMKMKGMDAQACDDMMKGMDHQPAGKPVMHHAVGVVKAADPSKGTVTLAHGLSAV